jgi:hypothetical protein
MMGRRCSDAPKMFPESFIPVVKSALSLLVDSISHDDTLEQDKQ